MTQSPAGTSPPDRRSGRVGWWWVAAATFVIGLVIGAVAAGLLAQDPPYPAGSTVAPVSSSTATPTATTQATVEILVNDSCLQAVSDARDAIGVIQQIVDAVKAVDLRALAGIVATVVPLQGSLREDVSGCRVTARLPDGSLVETGLPGSSAAITSEAVDTTATATG